MTDTTRLERAVEAFNRGDEAYFDFYADDVIVHGLPGTGGDVDRRGMIDFYRAFWAGVGGAQVVPADIVVGDRLVAVRLSVRGTHTGELFGVPPSGRAIDVEQITIFRLDVDGRCVERWVRIDEIAFLQQIGAMPAPTGTAA